MSPREDISRSDDATLCMTPLDAPFGIVFSGGNEEVISKEIGGVTNLRKANAAFICVFGDFALRGAIRSTPRGSLAPVCATEASPPLLPWTALTRLRKALSADMRAAAVPAPVSASSMRPLSGLFAVSSFSDSLAGLCCGARASGCARLLLLGVLGMPSTASLAGALLCHPLG